MLTKQKPRRRVSRRHAANSSRTEAKKGAGSVRAFFAQSEASLVPQVRAGLPYRALDRFQKEAQLTMGELSSILGVPKRTLHRRRIAGKLNMQESDRLVRACRVLARAIELFNGEISAARTWLRTPRPVLRNETPWQCAETELGAREVETLISRLEDGIIT
jgi:putative toxin-antitoxin system antitoxin component (TIGR02293 family)